MKKIFTLFITIGLLGTISLQAQNSLRCGTDQYLEEQKLLDPALEARMSMLDAQLREQIANNPSRTSAVITIPVIVHVLYSNTAQNISDAKIWEQIATLNRDFAKMNADTTAIPAIFKPIAANTQIQFCLAKRDPQGNATTGINRVFTNNSSFSTNNNIKFTSSGGVDIWDRNKYLNLWIGNLGSGLLGYAQFPGGSSTTDGVVVLYGSVGGPGAPGSSSPYHLGRTATHEVGHWLGLYHTFQGGCAGTSAGNCASAGDQVCDTPPTSSANYGCPSTKNTCTETPNDMPDNTHNYMDYVDDACMVMFTEGQAQRINGVMSSSRASLQTSNACTPLVSVNSPEALAHAVTLFPNPSTGAFKLSVDFAEAAPLNVKIFDVVGKLVFELEHKQVKNEKFDINLSASGKGMYHAIISSGQNSTSKKITITQ